MLKKKEMIDGKVECGKCKEWKELSHFSKNKNGAFGIKSWCKKCDRIGHLTRKYRPRTKYEMFKNTASKRGFKVTITHEQFTHLFSIKYCPVCNVRMEEPFDWKTKTKAEREKTKTIDRLDNDKGYHVENVACICMRCNCVKRNATPELLRKIANFVEDKLSEQNAVHSEW